LSATEQRGDGRYIVTELSQCNDRINVVLLQWVGLGYRAGSSRCSVLQDVGRWVMNGRTSARRLDRDCELYYILTNQHARRY